MLLCIVLKEPIIFKGGAASNSDTFLAAGVLDRVAAGVFGRVGTGDIYLLEASSTPSIVTEG